MDRRTQRLLGIMLGQPTWQWSAALASASTASALGSHHGNSGVAQPPMPRVLQISVDSAWAEGVPLFCRLQIIMPSPPAERM